MKREIQKRLIWIKLYKQMILVWYVVYVRNILKRTMMWLPSYIGKDVERGFREYSEM